MKKCGQILDIKAESTCGLDICCNECTNKCDKACKKESETCEYLRNIDNTELVSDNTELISDNDKFLNKNIDFLKEIKDFQIKFDKMKDQSEILKEKLKNAMKEFNVTEFENDFIKISLSKPYMRSSMDTKTLKQEAPDIYEKYKKDTEVQGKLTITAKVEALRL